MEEMILNNTAYELDKAKIQPLVDDEKLVWSEAEGAFVLNEKATWTTAEIETLLGAM